LTEITALLRAETASPQALLPLDKLYQRLAGDGLEAYVIMPDMVTRNPALVNDLMATHDELVWPLPKGLMDPSSSHL
jgi:hypothetical protein